MDVPGEAETSGNGRTHRPLKAVGSSRGGGAGARWPCCGSGSVSESKRGVRSRSPLRPAGRFSPTRVNEVVVGSADHRGAGRGADHPARSDGTDGVTTQRARHPTCHRVTLTRTAHILRRPIERYSGTSTSGHHVAGVGAKDLADEQVAAGVGRQQYRGRGDLLGASERRGAVRALVLPVSSIPSTIGASTGSGAMALRGHPAWRSPTRSTSTSR